MKTNFRQGIARYQTDALSTPIFLQKNGDFIDLIVAPDPTIIIFAHRSANYVVEEVRTVPRAWGPFAHNITTYIYWDINLVTGDLTHGATTKPPIYSASSPSNPDVDQHWFDTERTTMFVWSGTKWSERIRVFAGWVTAGAIVRSYPIGTQAGIMGEFEGGNVVLDAYLKPLRQSNGTFVTTVDGLTIVNNSARRVRFEDDVLSGMAAEPIPKFSLVRLAKGRRLELNRSTEWMSRIAGMVTEDLDWNEVGMITTDGLVRNDSWNFPADKINRPLFSGPNGELTLVPPTTGVLQVAGFVYDTDAVCLDIQPPIIIDRFNVLPDAVDPQAPIADFSATPYSGVAPLNVFFTNQSINPTTMVEWDFNNDGTVDSLEQNPMHTFYTPGVYTVRLRATNGFGFDEEVKTGVITVLQPANEGLGANLGIELVGPAWVRRNSSVQVAVSWENTGLAEATNVTRVITIPDVNHNQIQVSGLPVGSSVERSYGRTVISLPIINTLANGSTGGPIYFSMAAPPMVGTILVDAIIQSAEYDLTDNNNTASLSVEVRAS